MRPDIALFIDIDNISPRSIPEVLDYLLPNWNVPVRKAFGVGLAAKNAILRATGVEPIEVLPNLPTKQNVTDFALLASLMPELFFRRVHGFAIASGDSDFTAPVQQLRSLGLPVIVFGPESTPLCLQRACSQFRVIKAACVEPDTHQDTLAQHPPSLGPEQIRDWLIDLFSDFANNPGDLTVARFGQFLRRRNPQFTAKQYGAKSTSALLRHLGGFQLTELRNDAGTLTDYTLALVPHCLSAIDSDFMVAKGHKLMAISA